MNVDGSISHKVKTGRRDRTEKGLSEHQGASRLRAAASGTCSGHHALNITLCLLKIPPRGWSMKGNALIFDTVFLKDNNQLVWKECFPPLILDVQEFGCLTKRMFTHKITLWACMVAQAPIQAARRMTEHGCSVDSKTARATDQDLVFKIKNWEHPTSNSSLH